MGRKKKYPNGKALKTACENYFDAISYDLPEFVGGEPLLNRLGEQVVRRVWAVPPTLSGLCNRLGISRDTWAVYSADEEYSDVCKAAKAIIEEYLEAELSVREKSVQGLIFNLQNNYGWSGEKREVELGERAKAAADAANITIADKLALIGEVAEALGGKSDAGHDGGDADDSEERESG